MQLFYHHFGTGEPVIILHGLFGMSDNWVTHAKELSAAYSVYLPDLRNHGRSPHSPTFTYESMAEDLHEFIVEHKLKDPVIIGHSMGGKVAMQFALEYPDMLKKLVAIDISPVKYPTRDSQSDILTAMMSVNFDAVHSRKEIDDLLKDSIPDDGTRLFIMKNLHRRAGNTYDWRPNISAINNNMDHMFAGIESNSQFNKPVLFIKAGKSDYITEDHYHLIKKYFPLSKIVTVENSGHWVHVDAPGEVSRILREFIEEQAS